MRGSKTYVHSITTGRLFTSVTLSEGPEKRVGKSVFTEVTKGLIFDLVCGEVGYMISSALSHTSNLCRQNLRELAIASSEKASIGVAS